MEIHRKKLFDLVQKVESTASLEGAPENKISVGLSKILKRHIKDVPGDRVLLELFLKKGTLPFCQQVTKALQQDLLSSFSSCTIREQKPVGKSKTQHDIWKMVDRTKRVDYDPGPEPMPTPHDLQRYYRSLLDVLALDFPDGKATEEEVFLYRKEWSTGPYSEFQVPPDVFPLLTLVRTQEQDPPLFPLLDRLERFFFHSLLAFLPEAQKRHFLYSEWDGSEEALLEFEQQHYHDPLGSIVHDSTLSETEKGNRLVPLLRHWAHVERCHMLASLRVHQVEEFLHVASLPVNRKRKMNAAQMVEGMAGSGRRLKALDLRLNPLTAVPRMVNYLAFWDLSWLPWASSRILVPMDAATLPLSEKQFASQYFDPTTVFSKDMVMWCGKVPFRIEYLHRDGHRVVQTEDMFHQHRQYHESVGWEVPVSHLPRHERDVWNRMIFSWISSALSSFLDTKIYDVDKMTRTIVEPLWKRTTVRERIHLAYQVVGRLHPFFPLSRHHGVLKERIRHLYFSLEKMTVLPTELVFPEYFLAKDTQRNAVDELWADHAQEFQYCLLVQCARESFAAAGGGTLLTVDGLPRKSLDRNIYVSRDRHTTSLTEEIEAWEDEGYFWDEDLVPQGLEALRLFVEAPPYYRVENNLGSLSEADIHRVVDSWMRTPSFSYPPVCDEDFDDDCESEGEEEEEAMLEDVAEDTEGEGEGTDAISTIFFGSAW